MLIERDSSPRLHSRGVQCRVLLERIQCLIQAEANLIIEVTLAGRGFRRIIHQLKTPDTRLQLSSFFSSLQRYASPVYIIG